MSRETPELNEFTIDELAARAKMTVRNVRAYAGRGLIGAPRLAGRTGYYDREHLQRLQLIRSLLERGYTLTAVEQAMLTNPASSAGHALDLLNVLHQPSSEEEPEEMSRDSLAALAGVARNDDLIESLVELGLIEQIDDTRVRLVRPTIVRSGIAASAMGLQPETVMSLLPLLEEHLGAVADAFVDRVREEIWQPFVDAGMQDSDWPRILQVVETLLPVASQAVLGVFREQIARSIDNAMGEQIGDFEATQSGNRR
ncbi:MAG: MerR family transcriptional regulator [Aeromicrobium sp.]